MAQPVPAPYSATLHTRFEQMFPVLSEEEVGRLQRFGTLCRFGRGDVLFDAGKPSPGMYLIISGHASVTQRDGMHHVTPIVEQGPGQFIAEVGQLSGQYALVDVVADDDLTAVLIPQDRLRALIVEEAVLGERITRALILRRVSLMESGGGGVVLIGHGGSAAVVRLQGFLARNVQPHRLLDPSGDEEAAALVARLAVGAADLPLAVCPSGTILRNPTDKQLAREIGMVASARAEERFDVVIVGAGPSGLATAVYGASEGLSVAVVDRRGYGGQAGASARIENYFGFPTGISGQALSGRAYVQAQKFGTRMLMPVCVERLVPERVDGLLQIELDDGSRLRAKAVVVASGADYRRPAIPDLASFEGRGVWYWASPLEAKMCTRAEVVLVGGGNSAGQAAVFLAGFAAKVHMVIRGAGLKQTMSSYLISRIAAAPNIVLMPRTEVTALVGDAGGQLAEVECTNRETGATQAIATRNLFLFVGADPATRWLANGGVLLDAAGFVVTGGPAGRHLLESSIPGVFAVGDVRSGSVKRVGAAIGEGAQVVAALHAFLAAEPAPVPDAALPAQAA
ncbi:thioredoxin reductase [Rhodoferax koreense]|uniref:Thioredoxin reductase n=1 Tax=Rhodoferax koreensis TaxID=1842727 RepID=A0A1P8K3I8_9BURK|nr:FAD-dependent oxidoreductase [Rhodoferax koreense]APW40574.1 thioredoxin reductase [Rhodoferax koreense]